MRKRLLAIGSALAVVLMSASGASALTIGDSAYVGLIVDGIPANPEDEVNYINGLRQLPAGAPLQDCPPPGSTEDCSRVGSTIPSASLPVANTIDDARTEGTGTTFNPGTFEYVLAKYGNDGSRVWYIAGLSNPQTVPGFFNGTTGPQISHISLYNAGPTTTVPDGGVTAALLGLSMVGLGMLRRRFNL